MNSDLASAAKAISAGRFAEGEAICREILNGDPTNVDALMGLGISAYHQKRFDQAAKHLTEALRIQPENQTATRWAVDALRVSGQFEDAIALARDALKRNDDPGLWGQVGECQLALRRQADAQESFGKASALQPDQAHWHYRRAAVLLELGQRFEAMECLRIGARLAPDQQSLVLLSDLELEHGDLGEALRVAEQAHQFNPDEPLANMAVARCLLVSGRGQEAERFWEAAARGTNDWARVEIQRASMASNSGDFEQARECLGRVLEMEPDNIDVLSRLLLANRVTEGDRPLVARLEQLLASSAVPDPIRYGAEHALGKSYESFKDFERAMAHFDEANRVRLKATGDRPFDRRRFSRSLEPRRQAFDQDTVRRLAEGGEPSELPIFVVGIIRSGTTLAEQILSSHPDVNGAGEQTFWRRHETEFWEHDRLDLSGLRRLAPEYLRQSGGFSKRALRVIDKNPGNVVRAPALHIALPNARIIQMRRNPIDTALSLWTTWMNTDAPFMWDKENIVIAVQESERLMDYWRGVMPKDRFLEVQYENLIDDRERMTRKLIEFCGLPWSDECMTPEVNRKHVKTPSAWQVRQPVYRSSVDRWKNYEPWLGAFRSLLPPTV